MKVFILGKNSKNLAGLLKNLGFEMVNSNSDVVITYGGDGTLLTAERIYPGIPKLPIRDSLICKKCSEHQDEIVLKKLLDGKLKLKEYKKLKTEILYKSFLALNDFVIRNQNPIHTIRFKLPTVDDQLLIGDGVVIATPFGSTGYFKSITGKTFEEGFGLAFNNTTEKISPLFLKENEEINFELTRGKATLSFDNYHDIFNIDEESQLNFSLSDQSAKIYEDTSLRCPKCEVIRG